MEESQKVIQPSDLTPEEKKEPENALENPTGETFAQKFVQQLKSLSWQDWGLMAVIIFLLAINYYLTAPLKQLPNPIYGGDYYFQLGSTYHISASLNPAHWFTGSNILGTLPMVLPVNVLLVSIFIWVFKMAPLAAEFAFSYVLIAISSILIYILTHKILKNKTVALLAPLFFIPIGLLPIVKYTLFTQLVSMPLFLVLLVNFYREQNLKNGILLGLGYGFASLSHTVAFISVNWICLFVFGYLLFFQHRKERKLDWTGLKRYWKENYLPYVLVYALGLGLALLYWWKPIFVYHGQTLLGDQEWSMPSLSFNSVKISEFWSMFKNYFFNFSAASKSILTKSFLTLSLYLGLLALFFSKDKENSRSVEDHRFIKILLLGGATIVLSYFITEPLIHTNLVPSHNDRFLLSFGMLLTSFLGIKFIFGLRSGSAAKFSLRKIAFGAILFLLIFSAIQEAKARPEDEFYKQATLYELPPQLISLQEYLLKNSGIDDVVLSSNENSFAVNALTGRKVVTSRRAHNDKFLDFDKEEIKAAIILYGNNIQEKLKIIKENKVKYLYWDYYWIPSEYTFDNQGKINGWFDPLVFRYPEIYGLVLNQNGIDYFQQHTWLDPAARYPEAIQYDLLFVSPKNYRSMEAPWKEDLDPYLKEVWSYSQNGQKIARLFELKTESKTNGK